MRTQWRSRRALTLHAALVVAVPLFLALGLWQLHRALQGNALSWAYTFEWPFFAAYATWMWWKLLHEETAPRPVAAASEAAASEGAAPEGPAPAAAVSEAGPPAASPAPASLAPALSAPAPRPGWDPFDESDPELAAYNRYLARLHDERPRR